MITMNLQSDRQFTISGNGLTAFRNQKLSPDSVCEPIALGFTDKFEPVQRRNFPAIPELKKGDNVKPPQQCLIQKTSEQLPSVPEDAPRIPPRNPITKSRPRSVSEGETSTRRRAIFGQYWNQGKNNQVGIGQPVSRGLKSSNHQLPAPNLNTTFTPPPPNKVRKRSSSMTIIDAAGVLNEPIVDYRMFAPPKDHADSSPICGRFASVQDLPMSQLLTLPPLPSPLRRFCPEGVAPGCLQGMYPLITPIPILRQGSYTSLLDDKNKEERLNDMTTMVDHGQLSFNLTESWHWERGVSFDRKSSGSSSEASKGNSTKAGVRFDPRVTVTEFEDSIERSWYNDSELDKLRCDTILLAQEYLLTHPEQAERYNRAVLDPVTGTFRKKALFSLPVLSSTMDETAPLPGHKEYEQLLKSHVKTILIVDPNKAILDLFCKSMHSMFPTAILYKAQSGEEALQLVVASLQQEQGTIRGFDVIIVEQRLLRNELPAYSNFSSLRSLHEIEGKVTARTVRKPGSFFSESYRSTVPCTELDGSQVMQLIQRLENDAFNEQPVGSDVSSQTCKTSEANVLCSKPLPRRALLIGVSMQPDRDAKDFQLAGADIVWGKPIPKIGDALRNQLLHTLVIKRRRSLPTGICQSGDCEKESLDD